MPRPPKYVATAALQLAPSPQGLYVGTSGWAYPTWKPGFYPADVPSRAFLHFYAATLTSVEVNYTFRTLPSPAQVQGWLEATPPGFHFSFKAPQRITHFSRLRECGDEVERLLAVLRPVREAQKLGPVLLQLPPNFQADRARLLSFLRLPALQQPGSPRIAFEFRHPSWFVPDIYTLLGDYRAALCIADTDALQTPDVTTTDFRCFRLRRDGGYTPEELAAFAKRFTSAAESSETYVFFRHQDEPTGALNAKAMLDQGVLLAGRPHAGHA